MPRPCKSQLPVGYMIINRKSFSFRVIAIFKKSPTCVQGKKVKKSIVYIYFEAVTFILFEIYDRVSVFLGLIRAIFNNFAIRIIRYNQNAHMHIV